MAKKAKLDDGSEYELPPDNAQPPEGETAEEKQKRIRAEEEVRHTRTEDQRKTARAPESIAVSEEREIKRRQLHERVDRLEREMANQAGVSTLRNMFEEFKRSYERRVEEAEKRAVGLEQKIADQNKTIMDMRKIMDAFGYPKDSMGMDRTPGV